MTYGRIMSPIFQNILLGISLAAPIGPVAVEVIKRGLKRGFMAAFVVGLGSALGDFACLLITYIGLAKFVSIPTVKMSIWLLGALLLLFLGGQTIIEAVKKDILDKDSSSREGKNAFLLGFSLAMANPISIVWWLGVFGAVLGESEESISFMSFLGNTTIIVGVVLWFLVLSLFLGFGKKFVNKNRLKFISILAGLCLICFGCMFIYRAVLVFI